MITTLFILACVCNCISAYLNLRATQRWRRKLEENRETFERLLLFAAFMSRPESGAPEPIQKLAREALPEGARIDITRTAPFNRTMH